MVVRYKNLFFKGQLRYYLNLTRGFHLFRNFLLPVTGKEQVFSILFLLSEEAGKRDLFIPAVCLYQNRTTIVLWLGGSLIPDQREMEESVRLTYEAFCEIVGVTD